MPIDYPARYPGTRWVITYGSYTGIEQIAINLLQSLVQRYLPYVVELSPSAENIKIRQENIILVGTPQNNPAIMELLLRPELRLENTAQGYLIGCQDSPWMSGKRILLVAANTSEGILFAVQGLGKVFSSKISATRLTSTEGHPDLRQGFDALPDFILRESPTVERRGLWTWGYVIRDYRRYLDHMVRLRMNTLIIWNDYPPINSHQVIEYAHERGISIIYGFHWGWGLAAFKLDDQEDRRKIQEIVVENYRQNYQNLELDGIYFQTLTEHSDTKMHGMTTARAACLLVNATTTALHQVKPDLPIFFGLHATSIQSNYVDLQDLDSDVTIIWEDAGGIPFAYDPVIDPQVPPERTLDYSGEIAAFRPQTPFALVAKGWTTLRWEDEFEHHKPFIMGEQDRFTIRQRLAERQPQWNRINSLWLENYPVAARFYRKLLRLSQSGLFVTGLVEDGGFEETIQPSVAIFAETLWNSDRGDDQILREALNPYYQDN